MVIYLWAIFAHTHLSLEFAQLLHHVAHAQTLLVLRQLTVQREILLLRLLESQFGLARDRLRVLECGLCVCSRARATNDGDNMNKRCA
jgi:hypothetical protein